MTETATDTWYERVASEHRELNRMVKEIRDFLKQPRPEVGQTGAHRWASGLSRQLVELHDELVQHFRFEEQGGMVDEIQLKHPRAAGRVEVLVEEHRNMLAEIRDLMNQTLAYSEGTPVEEPALRTRLNRLFDHLADHESRENDLILRLEINELGLGD